jgi:hypothetical protein
MAKPKPLFGRIYGDPHTPSFITDEGVPVFMWRKGQKVRFYTAEGVQVGPEHANVFPAMCSAWSAGWVDPRNPMLSLMCRLEVRGQL